MNSFLSLIISVTSSDYNDVELNPTLKVDIDKRRKPVKNAETRLRLAERADGYGRLSINYGRSSTVAYSNQSILRYPVKRPDLSKPDRIEKAKDSAKKENAKGYGSERSITDGVRYLAVLPRPRLDRPKRRRPLQQEWLQSRASRLQRLQKRRRRKR